MSASGADLAILLRVAEENTAALKRVQTDITNMGAAANTAEPSFLKLSGAFAAGQIAAQAFLGVLGGAANAITGMIKGASDLNESLSKVDVIFGQNSQAVKDWAATTAQSIGQSKAEALAAAGQFGNLFKSMGMGAGATLDLSTKMVQLGGDLASFHNIRPEDALEKLRAGLVGESEPLRALGVQMNETMVKAKAMELGLAAGASGQLSEAAKVQARYAIILEQTKDAQGDFARTSTGMANAQRIINASFKDIGDQIGGVFLPVIATVTSAFATALPMAIQAVQPALASLGAMVAQVAVQLAPLGDMIKRLFGLEGGGGQEAGAAAAKAAEGIAAAVASSGTAATQTIQTEGEAAKAEIAAVDAQAREIDRTIHGINAEMTTLNEKSAALKFQTEDTKKSFEDQLRPLRGVHDELQQAARDAKEGFDQFLNPLKDSMESTKRQITDIKDGYANQIDVVKDQISALEGVNDTLRKQQDIQQDIEDLELRRKGLLAQGDPVKRADLQGKLDEIGFDKDHLSNQIQLLSLNNKKGDNDKKIASLRQEQNKLDAQAIGLREKLAGLVDRGALAEVKRAQALEAVQKAEQAIARKKEDVGIKEQIDPLKQQVKDLEAARDAAIKPLEANAKAMQTMYDNMKRSQEEALKAIEIKQRDNERAIKDTEIAQRKALEPLQEQADVLEREKSTLQLSAQHWQNIKQGITDSKNELEAAAKAAKASGLTQGAPVKAGGADKTEVLDPSKVATAPTIANHASLDMFKDIKPDKILGTLLESITASVPKILDTLQAWGKAFLDWIDPVLPFIPGIVADAVIRIGNAIIANWETISSRLQLWGRAFVEWLAPRLPDLIFELGKMSIRISAWILTEALPRIVEDIAKWGLAFVTWIVPRIPDMMIALGKLLMRLGDWAETEALPEIGQKIKTWVQPFLNWVGDVIAGLPAKLNEISAAIAAWLNEKGAEGSDFMNNCWQFGQDILKSMAKGITDSVEWFMGEIKDKFLDKFPDYVKQILHIESPSGVFRDIGHQVVAGLAQGLGQKWPDVEALWQKLLGGIIGTRGAAVSGDVTDWLLAAMGITGVGTDWMGGLQKLVSRENSSGDPGAQNPEHVVVNGVDYGQASGLMQMLPSTFRAHILDGMDDIWNPIHNAVSSIRYIQSHPDYGGTPYGIPGLFGGNYKGYKEGGILSNDGLFYGHRNEVVLNPRQQQQLLSGGSGGNVYVTVQVSGSVTTEQDLVECIRRGLIQTARRNGYSALGGYA